MQMISVVHNSSYHETLGVTLCKLIYLINALDSALILAIVNDKLHTSRIVVILFFGSD